jgi:hypothetical protein
MAILTFSFPFYVLFFYGSSSCISILEIANSKPNETMRKRQKNHPKLCTKKAMQGLFVQKIGQSFFAVDGISTNPTSGGSPTQEAKD